MKRSMQFVSAAFVVASLTLVMLAADAGAQGRKVGRDGFPGQIDWELRLRNRLPIEIYSNVHMWLLDRRKPFSPIEEYHDPAGAQRATGGRAGW